MKLHFHPVSTTSRPCLLFISEQNAPVELQVVDILKGEHLRDPFLTLNPNALVPVLEDGDFVLTESSSILKYLADKLGSPAYPKELRQRARVNEAMDWFNTNFYREYGYHLLYPQLFPHHKRPTDEINRATVEWGKTQSEKCLGVLDRHMIGSSKYLCGDEITIADYFGACLLSAGDHVRVNYGKFPSVKRWLDSIRSLPSWSKVNEVHNGFAESLKSQQFVTIS